MNARAVYIAILALAAIPGVATSRGLSAPSQQERQLGLCIVASADGHSWLEKTLWGLRDQEAGRVGLEIRNVNGSYDLGPFQVNSWWVPKLATMTRRTPEQVHRWLLHDPCFNVDVARWIFLSALAETGSYWKAVGLYHSPKVPRQMHYAARVADRMRRRFGPEVFKGSADDRGTPLDSTAGTNLP